MATADAYTALDCFLAEHRLCRPRIAGPPLLPDSFELVADGLHRCPLLQLGVFADVLAQWGPDEA
jgi:hypothetical protein